ncbi:multitransmembrane with signal peptide and GMGPP repeat at carboxy-terminus protein, putative [Babesia caballi]|uniref:Multitransmembrane with signal peptide and GMGPP repeat at carboxy-terminus protein, putative n=1 Tax=Babesia caballi TaxID=5871 RepID=A0AAV4LWA0_BABCB|nr:multitransmembrane with signal peptide and GMGPP repeat at carboxy-terminus protein, putative [Babesia caballi]
MRDALEDVCATLLPSSAQRGCQTLAAGQRSSTCIHNHPKRFIYFVHTPTPQRHIRRHPQRRESEAEPDTPRAGAPDDPSRRTMRKADGTESLRVGATVPSPSRVPNFFWFLAHALCVGGLLLEIGAICSPDWRVSEPIAYSYMHRGSRREHLVGSTRYGLYRIMYDDGGVVQTWVSKVASVKTKGYTAVQYNEQVGKGTYRSFESSYCPAACRDGIIIRIEGYEQLMMCSSFFAAALVVGCTFAALGMVWYLFVDESVLVTGGLWVAAAAILALATHAWTRYSYVVWKTIAWSNQIPFPFEGPNVKKSYIAASLIVGGAGLIALVNSFVSWRHTRQLQKSLQAQLRNKQDAMDPFNDPSSFDMFRQGGPSAPPLAPPQQGLNPSQLFSGIGFAQNPQGNYQYPSDPNSTGPSMWNTNFPY